MKTSNYTANTYRIILTSIAEKCTGRLAMAVAKNIRKLTAELQEYLEKRDELIKKYGKQAESGSYMISISDPEYLEFLKEMKEYDSLDCDFEPVLVSEEDMANSQLTAADMLNLDWMLDEE